MMVNVGDIFEDRFADFYQVVKTTAKTVTIRAIDHEFVGFADAYGWEYKYMPIKDSFRRCLWWDDETSERGRRCTVKDWTLDGSRPQIKIDGYIDAYIWDGSPAIHDTYN